MTTMTVTTDPVADLQAAMSQLLAEDPSEWTLAELADAIPALHTMTNQLTAAKMAVVAAFDARGGGQIAGHRSTSDWLAKTTRTAGAAAGWTVHTARALRNDLPATAQALADGAIDTDHLRAIRQAHRTLRDGFAQIEDEVVDYARDHTVIELRTLIDLLIQQYGPEEHDRKAEFTRDRRRAKLSETIDGWWHLTGFLDATTGAALAAAMDVYANPTGPSDPRSPGNLRADALAEIATRALDTTDRPTGIGYLTLTLTPEQLATGDGASWPSGLVASRTDIGEQSCSAKVTYVIGQRTDDIHWQPLAVGFAQRYATKAQRAALAVRDGKGCIYPGCPVPAHRCIAHHIRHWKDGGPTDVDNLVLICRYHHRRVHHGRLTITQTPTGRFTTAPITRGPP